MILNTPGENMKSWISQSSAPILGFFPRLVLCQRVSDLHNLVVKVLGFSGVEASVSSDH